jgi:hypothetical protein
MSDCCRFCCVTDIQVVVPGKIGLGYEIPEVWSGSSAELSGDLGSDRYPAVPTAGLLRRLGCKGRMPRPGRPTIHCELVEDGCMPMFLFARCREIEPMAVHTCGDESHKPGLRPACLQPTPMICFHFDLMHFARRQSFARQI